MDIKEYMNRLHATVPTNPRIRIALEVEGATEDDLASGIQAAIAVFVEAGADPREAAGVSYQFEWGDFDEMSQVTDEDIKLDEVYRDAIDAALKVACQDLPNTPKKYCFSLLWDDKEPSRYDPEIHNIEYPVTFYGRPPEEIQTLPTGKRRKLLRMNWEWENVKG